MRGIGVLLVLLAAALPVRGAAAQPDANALRASVGPGELSLVDESGTQVERLDPGTYSIAVSDSSPQHNVHISGPGVALDSGLAFVGTVTWTATFRDAVYSVVSDPQAGTLRRVLAVGSPPEPRLRAVVTDSAITLTQADGAPAARLEPGTYGVAVDDRSTRESFRLIGPGVEEHTQRHIAARTTWLVTLTDGVYHFFSDRRPESLRGSVVVASGAAPTPTRTLRGITGSDFAIALVDSTSAPVTRLQRGTYTIEIDDRSPDHNLRLQGPGVERATRLEQVGRVTWTVRLGGGTYSLLCDPHTLTMFRTFSVPSGPATRLMAALTVRGAPSLRTQAGRPVRALPAGVYLLTIRDHSGTGGFRLSGPGVRRATGRAFVGTVTWRLELRPGTYRYGARLERTVVVGR